MVEKTISLLRNFLWDSSIGGMSLQKMQLQFNKKGFSFLNLEPIVKYYILEANNWY